MDDEGPGGVSATERTAHGQAPEPDAELTAVVRELTDRIETLQADVRRLGGPGLPAAEPGWIDEDAGPAITPSYAWVSSLGAPIRRRPAVPRLLLEVLFLAAVAIAAAVAKLDAGCDRRRDGRCVGPRGADRVGRLARRSAAAGNPAVRSRRAGCGSGRRCPQIPLGSCRRSSTR